MPKFSACGGQHKEKLQKSSISDLINFFDVQKKAKNKHWFPLRAPIVMNRFCVSERMVGGDSGFYKKSDLYKKSGNLHCFELFT